MADYKKFASHALDRTKQKELVDKSAIASSIKNADLNKKVLKVGTKAELKAEQDKMTQLQAFDSS